MADDTQQRIGELEAQVQSLKAVRAKLERALEATDTYTWEWDLDSDTVERHPSFEQLFGIDAAELEPVFENFVARVHTNYREDVEEAFETAVDEGSSYHVRYPLTVDGEETWLEGQGDVVLEDGEPVRIVGTTRRIPEPEDA